MSTRTWIETWARRAAFVSACSTAACASHQPTTPAPASRSMIAKPAQPSPAAESPADYSSAAGYTRTALALLRKGDPKGSWVSPQLLKLSNSSGLGMVEKQARQAARPVSNALLKWTPGGWQELKP